METFKQGDRVHVPWGVDDVWGTVLSLFGPAQQFARVEVELPGDPDAPVFEVISLPVDLLSHPTAA